MDGSNDVGSESASKDASGSGRTGRSDGSEGSTTEKMGSSANVC